MYKLLNIRVSKKCDRQTYIHATDKKIFKKISWLYWQHIFMPEGSISYDYKINSLRSSRAFPGTHLTFFPQHNRKLGYRVLLSKR